MLKSFSRTLCSMPRDLRPSSPVSADLPTRPHETTKTSTCWGELSFLDHAINNRILLFHLLDCNLAVSVIWAKSILGLSSGFFGSWGWLIEDELLHFNTMFFWSHIRAQQVLRVKQVQNCMRISLHECVKINWKGYEYTKCSLCDVPKSSDAPHYPLSPNPKSLTLTAIIEKPRKTHFGHFGNEGVLLEKPSITHSNKTHLCQPWWILPLVLHSPPALMDCRIRFLPQPQSEWVK